MKKQLIMILIFLIFRTVAFGQLSFLKNDPSIEGKLLPEKVKTIRVYEDDLLLNIKEYDTLKNLTFSYNKQYVSENWNGKHLTVVIGSIFNELGEIEKSYLLHSNAGLSIKYYEYDSVGNNTKLFTRDNDYEHQDSLINTNPYRYISEITTINELISHPKIEEIERESQKHLNWERTYDSIGNILTELSFKENGDTSGYQRYEYDEYNNKIYFYNEWSKEDNWEYYYEYDRKHSFFEEENEPEIKPSKLLQSVRVDFDSRENRKKVSNITFYKYDNKDRLIEEIEYDRGEFKNKYKYEYNDKNQVTKRVFYIYDIDKIASIKTYSYNKEGNMIKEINEDFRSNKKEEIKYRYEYEYYD